jgi:hypothetical protein
MKEQGLLFLMFDNKDRVCTIDACIVLRQTLCIEKISHV